MIEITAKELTELRNTKKELFLVDFYADWCGPCKALAPILEELQKETNIGFYKVNIEDPEIQPLLKEFDISSIPTVIFFKEGIEPVSIMGFNGKDAYKEVVEKLVL